MPGIVDMRTVDGRILPGGLTWTIDRRLRSAIARRSTRISPIREDFRRSGSVGTSRSRTREASMSVKVSVNLSRKRSHNFDSDCVTVGVETEVQSLIDRPGRAAAGDLGALPARGDGDRSGVRQPEAGQAGDPRARRRRPPRHGRPRCRRFRPRASHCPSEPSNGPPLASGKQVSFIRTLAKRNKLSEAELSTHIGAVTGDVRAAGGLDQAPGRPGHRELAARRAELNPSFMRGGHRSLP